MARRIGWLTKKSRPIMEMRSVKNATARAPDPRSVAALCGRIAHRRNESAAFAYLGRCGKLLRLRTIGSSHTDMVALPIRRIVREAILLDADRMMMAHNHPSGIVQPSRADIDATRRLSRALAMFDVRLVDHWIVTADKKVSLRALGLM